jgi:Pyruvate/2-oxoacid:ferredoxin oxidoreductase gamma subunit
MESSNIAAAGIQSAVARFEESARRTERAQLDRFAEEQVTRRLAQRDVEANVKVVQAADEMTGTMLDVRA